MNVKELGNQPEMGQPISSINFASPKPQPEIIVQDYMRIAAAHGNFGQDVNDLRARQLEVAIRAAKNAYAPYSKFHVGAALLTLTANIYGGCNVENVMYNGMSHAELTAITAAIVNEGPDMLIMEMTVWTPTDEPCPCCGACRQLIREHAASDEVIVWAFCQDPTVPPTGMMVKELLPNSFGPENIA